MDVTRKFRLWQKFASIAVIGAAIIALPLYHTVASLRGELQAARVESAAIDPERQLLRLMRALQSHRLHAARWLDGDAPARAEAEVDAAGMAAALEAASRAFASGPGSRPGADEAAASLGRRMAALHAQVTARTIDRSASLLRHEQLMLEVQSWIDAEARGQGLTLDADPASGPLLAAGLAFLPRVQAALALALVPDLPAAAPGTASIDQRVVRAGLLDRMRIGGADADQALDRAMEAQSALRVALGPRARLAADARRQAADLVEQQVRRPGRHDLGAPASGVPDLGAQLSVVLDAQAELADAALSAAGAIITERRTDCLRTLMTVALTVGMGGAMVVSLMWSIARSTTLTVVQATRVAHAFGDDGAPGGRSAGGSGDQALDLGVATVSELLGAIQRSSHAVAGASSSGAPPPAPVSDQA